MMNIVTTIIILAIVVTCFKGTLQEFIRTKITLDIIQSFDRPHLVNAFMCLNKIDSFSFLKVLSKNNVAASILKTTDQIQINHVAANRMLIVVDLNCYNSYEVLVKANKMKLFLAPYKWLLFNGQNINFTSYEKFLANMDILIDSELIVANLESNTNYTISKYFKRAVSTPIVEDKVGSWSSKSGLILEKQSQVISRRRRDLMGIVLKGCVVVAYNDSLNHLTDRHDKHLDATPKVAYIMTEYLKEILNFSITNRVENHWGYKINSTHWNGILELLQQGEIDIGVSPIFMRPERVSSIDYIAMTCSSKSRFVFRQPRLSYVTDVYILPFHWTVWVSLFTLVIITAWALYIVTKWEGYNASMTDDKDKAEVVAVYSSWMDVIMLSYGAMCQQGASIVPSGFSGRFVTIVTFISLMFLYTSYAANIVALLQSPSDSIRTLKDLLNARMDVGVEENAYNHVLFPDTDDPVRLALYKQKVVPRGQPENFFSRQKGVELMRTDNFAFHMETGIGYRDVVRTFEEHEKCGLQEISYLQVTEPWTGLPKKSPYKEVLKIGFFKIQERGLQTREHLLFYIKKPTCATSGGSFISVGLVDCYLAAVVFCGGMAGASVFLGLEILIFRIKARKQFEVVRKD